jgi:hypothetical protein
MRDRDQKDAGTAVAQLLPALVGFSCFLIETDALVAVWLKDPTETVKWRFAIGELDKTQISSIMAHLTEPEPAAARASVPCTN